MVIAKGIYLLQTINIFAAIIIWHSAIWLNGVVSFILRFLERDITILISISFNWQLAWVGVGKHVLALSRRQAINRLEDNQFTNTSLPPGCAINNVEILTLSLL